MGIMQLLHLIFIYAVQFRYLIFWFLTIRRKQSFQAEKRNYLKSWPLFVFGWGAAMAGCVWTRYPASRLCTAPSPQPSSSVTTPELFTFQFSAENIWKIGRRQAGRWKVYKFRSEPGTSSQYHTSSLSKLHWHGPWAPDGHLMVSIFVVF